MEQEMNVKDTQVLPEESEKITEQDIRRGAEVFMLLLKWEQEIKQQKIAPKEDIV